jgi:hypothetical protein
MIPQVHFNFGPTSLDRFYQFALPVVPGGVFVGGALMAHAAMWQSLRDTLGLGQYGTLLAVLFAAYVAGVVLFAFSAMVTAVVTGVGAIPFNSWKPIRDSYFLSQCTIWRQVAAKFLGELAPVLPTNPAPVSVTEKIMRPMKDLTEKRQHDELWEEWYRILQDYLLRNVPILPDEMIFVWIALESTGWAAVVLSFVNPHIRHWAVYGVAGILILSGALLPLLTGLSYMGSERLTYWHFTARLLAEIHKAESSTGELQPQQPPKEVSFGKRVVDSLLGHTKSD